MVFVTALIVVSSELCAETVLNNIICLLCLHLHLSEHVAAVLLYDTRETFCRGRSSCWYIKQSVEVAALGSLPCFFYLWRARLKLSCSGLGCTALDQSTLIPLFFFFPPPSVLLQALMSKASLKFLIQLRCLSEARLWGGWVCVCGWVGGSLLFQLVLCSEERQVVHSAEYFVNR